MRHISIAVLLLASSLTALGKDREWKDAVFLGVVSGNSGAAAMPIGTMTVAVPLTSRFYVVKSENITYYLRTSYTGHWPNLTVNRNCKFAVEGRNAHVLDEDNKDRKFSIVEKVADK